MVAYDLSSQRETVLGQNVCAFTLDGSNVGFVNLKNEAFYKPVSASADSPSPRCQISKPSDNIYHLATVMKHALIFSGFSKVGSTLTRYITLVDKRFMNVVTEFVETSTAGRPVCYVEQDLVPLIQITPLSNYKQNLNVLVGLGSFRTFNLYNLGVLEKVTPIMTEKSIANKGSVFSLGHIVSNPTSFKSTCVAFGPQYLRLLDF